MYNKLNCRLRFDIAVRSPSQRYSSVKFMYGMWHAFNIQIKMLSVNYFCKCTAVVRIPRRKWFRRHTRAMTEIHLINYKTKWQCTIRMKAILFKTLDAILFTTPTLTAYSINIILTFTLKIYLLITLLIHALLTIQY